MSLRGMSMKKKQPDMILRIVVIILICGFFYQFKIPPFVTCLFIAVGYLAYEAYKK